MAEAPWVLLTQEEADAEQLAMLACAECEDHRKAQAGVVAMAKLGVASRRTLNTLYPLVHGARMKHYKAAHPRWFAEIRTSRRDRVRG